MFQTAEGGREREREEKEAGRKRRQGGKGGREGGKGGREEKEAGRQGGREGEREEGREGGKEGEGRKIIKTRKAGIWFSRCSTNVKDIYNVTGIQSGIKQV